MFEEEFNRRWEIMRPAGKKYANFEDYLNQNTKYNWDVNEIYDNCVITESENE